MIVFVNNNLLEMKEPEKIPGILQLVNIPDSNGIAVAVNNAVVPRAEWESFTVHENDQLTVIRATQGG